VSVVVTADDIPGDNVVQLIRDDQPILARKGGEIRHKEEPILLLAAADRDTLEEAISHLRIEYDTAEPIFALDQARTSSARLKSRKARLSRV